MTKQANHPSTLADAVCRAAERFQGTAVKFRRGQQWVSHSWNEYGEKIMNLALGLASKGISKGARVVILSQTCHEWGMVDFACQSIGAIVVPIYPSSTPEDVTFITNQTEACALFIDDSCLNIWKLCLDKCPSVRDVILLNRTEAKDYTTVHSLTLLGSKVSNRNAAWKELAGKIKPQDVSTIIYTSGTTGIPKGVIITHEQIVSELNSAFGLFQIGPGDSSLCFLPLAHVLGRVELWGHIWWGYQICYAESIEKLRQNLKDIAPTFLIAVPRVFEKIYVTVTAQLESALFGKHIFREALEIGLKISEYRLQRRIIPLSLIVKHQLADRVALSKVREAFGGKLRFAVCGGAPLSEEIARFFHACGVLILEGYGLTETTAAICVNTPFNYRFGSVGCVIGQNQIKIAEDGEILVKGPNVMKGYYKNPEATAAAFEDGRFKTGDIGEFLPGGHLRITDRKKDLIKTAGGKFVAPQKIESLLRSFPLLGPALIHGDKRKYIVALLTLDPQNAKAFAAAAGLGEIKISELIKNEKLQNEVRTIIAKVNSRLAGYESIKRYKILPDEFTIAGGELTPSLKVRRKLLEQRYASELDSLYS